MLNQLKKVILKQNLQPTWFRILVNPFFLIRHHLYKRIKSLSHYISGDLIDFGSGRKPYENLFNVKKYVGVDVKISGQDHVLSKIDVYYNGATIPLPDGSFNSMISFEVLEHVFNLNQIVPELNRVLKKAAKVLLRVPFCWNESEVPFYYARYHSYGIKHLQEDNGFKVIELHKRRNYNRVIGQLRIVYFFEIFRPLKKVGYIFALLFSLPLVVLTLIISNIFPKNKSYTSIRL